MEREPRSLVEGNTCGRRGMKARALLALLLAFGLVASACGGDEGGGGGGGARDIEVPDVGSVEELRELVQGKSVVIGTSAFPNASITGQFKTVDFLQDEFGIQVDFRVLDSDPLVAATLSGDVAVGGLSLAGVASASSAGGDFIAWGGDDQKNPFLVAAKTPIDSLEELAGKPFGVTQNLNQITGQTATKCLDQVGMDVMTDVQLIRLGNTGEVTEAIASGQVAGGISATFRLTQLVLDEGEGVYNVLCRGWEANPQISTVWYSTREWLRDNPDLALAISIASLKSARWIAEDKERWIDYAVSVVEGYTPEAGSIDYDTLVNELDDWPVNGSLDRELMQTTLDTSFEFEAVDQQYTVDQLATFAFQEKALEIMGTCPGGTGC